MVRDVGAALQQVGGEGMPKGMRADLLRQPGTAYRHLDGLVNDAGVNVLATGDTGTRVHGEIPGGEDILPAPFRRCQPILPFQRMGQGDGPIALRQILLMQGFDPGEVVLEERDERRGKGREAILLPLA